MNVSTPSDPVVANLSTNTPLVDSTQPGSSTQVMTLGQTPVDEQEDLLQTHLLWVPAVGVMLFMSIFLGVSFFRYHRRFRRKHKSAMDYVDLHLDRNRPRIKGPQLGVIFHEHDSNESSDDYYTRYTGVADSSPPEAKACFTYTNPAFENDIGEDDYSRTCANTDFHREHSASNSPATTGHTEVDIKLSSLCQECLRNVVNTGVIVQRPGVSKPNFPVSEYKPPTSGPEDESELIDAFHGGTRYAPRRRSSGERTLNKYAAKETLERISL